MTKKVTARIITFLLAILLLASGLTVSAAEKDDFVDCTYIRVTGENFVCDSLNGVNAYYNLYGSTWYCNEYVDRYYSTIYSVDINYNSYGPYISSNTECYLNKLTDNEDPQSGDIIFWPVNLRNKNYFHTAIVKDYADGIITIIEQNWSYGSYCSYERQVSWPSSNYYVYSFVDPNIPIYMTAVDDVVIIDESAPSVEVKSSPCTSNDFINLCSSAISGKVSVSLISGSTLSLVMGVGASNDDITREDAFIYIYKLLEATGVDIPRTDAEKVLSAYSDQADISDDARDAAAVLTELGVINGGLSMNCMPDDALTVEQCNLLMMRVAGLLA